MLPTEVVSTKWADYHHWRDEPPCDNIAERLDSEIEGIAAGLEIALPDDFRIQYFKLRSAEAKEVLPQLCELEEVGACAELKSMSIYSASWVHPHELSHLVTATVGSPPALFEESVAQLFNCGVSRWKGALIDRSYALGDVLATEAFKRKQLGAGLPGQAFLSFLLRTYGATRLQKFFASVSHEADATAVEDGFRAAFDVALVEALAAWRASPPQHEGEVCLFVRDACRDADALPLAASEHLDFRCEGATRRITFNEPTSVSMRMTATEPRIYARVRSCDAATTVKTFGYTFEESAFAADEFVGHPVELRTDLAAGAHSIEFLTTNEGPSLKASTTLSVMKASSAISLACDAGAPTEIAPDTFSLTFAYGSETTTGLDSFARIQLSDARRVRSYHSLFVPSSTSRAFACPSACLPYSACADLMATDPVLSGESNLRFVPERVSRGVNVQLVFTAP